MLEIIFSLIAVNLEYENLLGHGAEVKVAVNESCVVEKLHTSEQPFFTQLHKFLILQSGYQYLPGQL